VKGNLEMEAKPPVETILQTYSLEELLDLAKMKARRLTDENLEALKKHIDSFIPEKSGGVGITAGREWKITKPPEPEMRAEKKMSLGRCVLEVLGSEPLKIDKIMEAVLARGYKSRSKNLKQMLAVELSKQVKKNTIKKVKPGVYVRK